MLEVARCEGNRHCLRTPHVSSLTSRSAGSSFVGGSCALFGPWKHEECVKVSVTFRLAGSLEFVTDSWNDSPLVQGSRAPGDSQIAFWR